MPTSFNGKDNTEYRIWKHNPLSSCYNHTWCVVSQPFPHEVTIKIYQRYNLWYGHNQPVPEVLDRLEFKKFLYGEARKWVILWRQTERMGSESSHGFLYRCTHTHTQKLTCIHTRFFVNCGVHEGNWTPAYCLSKAWGIVEAYGHYYDPSLHIHKGSCSVLQNVDTVRRLKKTGPTKHTTIYESKNIPRSSANSSPP